MSRTSMALETLAYLIEHEPAGGVDINEMSYDWGVGIQAVRQRIRVCRKYLRQHPELRYAVPRPTAANGWLYRATNDFSAPGADIRDGHIDENIALLGLLPRLIHETEIAYDKEVSISRAGRRSARATKLLARIGHYEALKESIASDQTVMSTRLT